MEGEPEWDSGLRKRMREDQLRTPAFERLSNGRVFCLEELIKRAKLSDPKFFLDIPKDGSRVRKSYSFDFEPGEVQFLALRGYWLKRITLSLLLWAVESYS